VSLHDAADVAYIALLVLGVVAIVGTGLLVRYVLPHAKQLVEDNTAATRGLTAVAGTLTAVAASTEATAARAEALLHLDARLARIEVKLDELLGRR